MTAPSERIDSLLVLPLKNLSGDPEQDYFADGMTDALNARLAGVSALRVISQTSSLVYRGTHKPLSQIARELNVNGIVEGSVLRSGDRVRINVQLVQPATEKRIWGQTYEHDVQDVLALQSEVTRAIVTRSRQNLRPGRAAARQCARIPSRCARRLRQRPLLLEQKNRRGPAKGGRLFRAGDRERPCLCACLRRAWRTHGYQGHGTRIFRRRKPFPTPGRQSAKALELDPDLAEAHTTLAFIKLYYEWDWAAADREFLRAIELNPNYANAHHWYGEYLSLVGRHNLAIREAERARELDPLSSIINTWVGSRYFFARRYDTAVEQYRNVVELDPGFVPAHLALGQAYVQRQMFPEAIRELEKAVDLSGGSPVYLASLAHAYGVTGRKRDTSR